VNVTIQRKTNFIGYFQTLKRVFRNKSQQLSSTEVEITFAGNGEMFNYNQFARSELLLWFAVRPMN